MGRCTVRLLDDAGEMHAASQLLARVWDQQHVMPANLIRAISHAGGYVSGAWLDGSLVGASVAFRGTTTVDGVAVPTLHSHITGVLVTSRGLGMVIKAHQREWAAAQDIVAITWTFDPLVARNAYFNLHKLGAVGHAYLPNHYGPMDDGINRGDESDRLEAWWPTAGDASTDGRERTEGLVPLLRVGPGDQPQATGMPSWDSDGLSVQVPRDIEALRRSDPATAAAWRLAVRQTLGAAISRGYRATGMGRDGTYALTRPAPATTAEEPPR